MTEADKDRIKKLFELDFPDAAKAIKNRTKDETFGLAMYQAYKKGFERGGDGESYEAIE